MNPNMDMQEEWRDIPGYEGVYQVSIATIEGKCRRLYKNGLVRVLSNKPNKGNGRIMWDLSLNGRESRKSWQAARWIALSYPELIENEYFEGAHIDHKDTNPLNNQPSNLHWVTIKGNANNPVTLANKSQSHKGKHLTAEHKENIRIGNIGKHMRNDPTLSKPVIQYNLDGEYLNDYPSIQEAERVTGVKNSNIRKCLKKYRQTAGGFVWKYKA